MQLTDDEISNIETIYNIHKGWQNMSMQRSFKNKIARHMFLNRGNKNFSGKPIHHLSLNTVDHNKIIVIPSVCCVKVDSSWRIKSMESLLPGLIDDVSTIVSTYLV